MSIKIHDYREIIFYKINYKTMWAFLILHIVFLLLYIKIKKRFRRVNMFKKNAIIGNTPMIKIIYKYNGKIKKYLLN